MASRFAAVRVRAAHRDYKLTQPLEAEIPGASLRLKCMVLLLAPWDRV
jgi:hypothetical protein